MHRNLTLAIVVPALFCTIDARAAQAISYSTIDERSETTDVNRDARSTVEANRPKLIARMVDQYRAAMESHGISTDAFQAALWDLAPDRLLAASLADSVEEVNTIVAQSLAGPTRADAKDGPGTGANSWIGYTAGNNQASGTGSAVAAGTNNVASGQNSFVGAGTFNAANGQGSFVGGGTSNVANATSALVMGGFDNRATVIDSAVVAGAGNRATGARSVVVGGGYNLASGQWSFVGGGGRQTTNSGGAGTFVEDNVAAANFSTIGGGQGNRTPGGNTHGTVAGGLNNTASGFAATVAGGSYNNAIATNQATVGGGDSNTASGAGATVVGGFSNTASGVASTVLGGSSNLAGGDFSVVVGSKAQALVSGSFVFSDGNGQVFYSGLPNEFLVGATGGIGMYTAKNYSTGCHISAGGGAWSCSSSREVKRDFADVDTDEVLRKAIALPLSSWRYVNEPKDIRHTGPMAQDFRAAFGLGEDDQHISTVDAEGIALAALQGLDRKLEQRFAEKNAKIDALMKELRAQSLKIAELQAALHDVVALRATPAKRRSARADVNHEQPTASAQPR